MRWPSAAARRPRETTPPIRPVRLSWKPSRSSLHDMTQARIAARCLPPAERDRVQPTAYNFVLVCSQRAVERGICGRGDNQICSTAVRCDLPYVVQQAADIDKSGMVDKEELGQVIKNQLQVQLQDPINDLDIIFGRCFRPARNPGSWTCAACLPWALKALTRGADRLSGRGQIGPRKHGGVL